MVEEHLLTRRYPPLHPVTNMPNATLTRALPKTAPATVGIKAKNPPAAVPLSTTKAIKGPREVDTGHKASKLNPLSASDPASVLSGPSRSLRKPDPILPTAEERLNPATRAAAVLDERPSEVL